MHPPPGPTGPPSSGASRTSRMRPLSRPWLGFLFVGVDEGTRSRHRQLGEVDWLRRRYVDDGASVRELARDIGCSHSQVRLALARAGIPNRSQGEPAKLRGLARQDAVWLVEEYGITGAARHLEVSEQTFDVAVAALGIRDLIAAAAKTYDQRRRKAGPLWPPLLHDREALAAEYTAKNATTIASEL